MQDDGITTEGIEQQNDTDIFDEPKTSLKITVTMIPLMMMTKPSLNSDFLKIGIFLHLVIFLE